MLEGDLAAVHIDFLDFTVHGLRLRTEGHAQARDQGAEGAFQRVFHEVLLCRKQGR